MTKRSLWTVLLILGLCSINRAADQTVPDDPKKIHPILIGSTMPNLTFKNPAGETVNLHAILKDKPTVLVYYRGGWCPFCTQQLAALGKKQAELQRLGFQTIAVSADKPAKIKETAAQMSHDCTLLSDNTMEGAKALGIAFKLPKETVDIYKEKYKIDVEADSGKIHHLLPVPSVFIIDREGKITFHYINPNYRVRLDDDLLIAAAKAALK